MMDALLFAAAAVLLLAFVGGLTTSASRIRARRR
jgi:hypothetical protein